MNEEAIEDRHYIAAAKRAHEARKEAAERIIRKAKELAAEMTNLGRLGIKCDVEIVETTSQRIDQGEETFMYHARVKVSEPPVVLGATAPVWVR